MLQVMDEEKMDSLTLEVMYMIFVVWNLGACSSWIILGSPKL